MGKRSVMLIVFVCLIGCAFVTADCVFGPNPYYAVMSHRGNRVFIRHDRWYFVGELPAGWEDLDADVKAASWYHPEYLSTISTAVFCESTVGDKPLETVAAEVAGAIEDRTVTQRHDFMLDRRGALRETVSGTVDGVPLRMDVVVLKKHNCAFDFVAIAPPDMMPVVRPVFESFFEGFHYE